MKINIPNSKIHFRATAEQTQGSGTDMGDNIQGYDEYTQNLIDSIQEKDSSKEVERLLLDISKKDDGLEQLASVLYKHGDTHITILFEYFGKPFVENLKILNKLKIQCAPEYIETINKNGTMFVITKLKDTENGKLEDFIVCRDKVSKEEKLKVFHDLQKLTKAGLVDDGVLRGGAWYVTPKNTIVLPNWQRLRKIQPNESQQEIIQGYYNILFGGR